MISDNDEYIFGINQQRIIKTSYTRSTPARSLDLSIDFSFASIEQVTQWAMAERVIAFQRVLRQLPTENAFDAFHDSVQPLEIFAIEAGVKLENHTDKQELYKQIMGEQE